jgi:hypothetical protein
MFVTNVWSLPAMITVLSFASIAGIAVVDVIPGEIESEVMVARSVTVTTISQIIGFQMGVQMRKKEALHRFDCRFIDWNLQLTSCPGRDGAGRLSQSGYVMVDQAAR